MRRTAFHDRASRYGAPGKEETGMHRIGGGVLVAISLIIGFLVGVSQGQGSLGIIGGLVVGLLLAGLVNWWDARRQR